MKNIFFIILFLLFFNLNTFSQLSQPQLLAPMDSSTNISLNPTLSWSSVAGAISYRLQISTNPNFTTLHTNVVETTTNVVVSGLLPLTQYWWRVCAKDSTDSTSWTSPKMFTTKQANSSIIIGNGTDFDISQPFDRFYSYSTCESIYKQANLGNAKLIKSIAFYKGNGTNKQQITGVQIFMKLTTQNSFQSGNYSLSGYTLVYQGNFPNNLDSGWLEVDLTTPFYYNGTSNLQMLVIKSYQEPVDYFDAPAWRFSLLNDNLQRSASSDVSQPTYLDAIPFRPDTRFRFETNFYSQTFPLVNGWNMISANVEPLTNNISSLMQPLSGNLQILRNYTGQAYVPPFTNTLSNWNKYHAYQLRMTTSQQYEIQGMQITPETTPITLNVLGWYWLPYYRTSAMPVGTALATISGKYLQVKTITGQVYMPPFATTLSDLEPGKGYMIRLIQDNGVLTYPANGIIKGASNNKTFAEPKVFVRPNVSTGKNAFIAMDINAQDGDEIGVFTRDGMLVGASVWQDGLRGVVVWGDDEFTVEKDGATEGEELIVKVWSRSNETIGEVKGIETKDMANGGRTYGLRYETDAVVMLKGTVEAGAVGVMVTPQPASNELYITLGKLSSEGVAVELYNQSGRLMLSESGKATNGVLKLDVSSLPSGVYNAVIRTAGTLMNERVVIVR